MILKIYELKLLKKCRNYSCNQKISSEKVNKSLNDKIDTNISSIKQLYPIFKTESDKLKNTKKKKRKKKRKNAGFLFFQN